MPTTHLTELLPWHEEIYGHLCSLNKEQKLAHAYLLEGQQALGKLSLARHFAHYLLCQSPTGLSPCNQCQACHLVAAQTHPDFKLVMPEETKNIKIDQVRETLAFMSNTALRGGRKIIIFAPAESLNTNAANALLKALEEPASGTLLLLVSHQPALLMATIKSRCQKLKFSRPDKAIAEEWLQTKNISGSAEILLKLANGAPLKALLLADEDASHERGVLHSSLEKLLSGEQSVIEAAVECSVFDIGDNIEGMMLCIADVLEHNQSNQQEVMHDPDLKGLAKRLKGRMRIQALHRCYQDLIAAKSALNTTANPNPQLILESLFFNWSRLKDMPLTEERATLS